MRIVLVALLVVLVGAACGGEATPETVTETETVVRTVTVEDSEGLDEAELAGREAGASDLALDLCTVLPVGRIAQFAVGADPNDPDEVAEAFGESVRPDLRAAAVVGCRAGLE